MRSILLFLAAISVAASAFEKEHVQFTTDGDRALFVRVSAIQSVERKEDRLVISTVSQVISLKLKPNFRGLADDLDTVGVAYFALLALVGGEEPVAGQKQFTEWLDLVRNKDQMKVIREGAAVRVTTYEARIECASFETNEIKKG